MNYREATLRARSGQTVFRAGREVRFLTPEEAEVVYEAPVEPSRVARFGLYDVSSGTPVQFRPTEEDIKASWSSEPIVEAVSPEVVDEVLHEEQPQ